MSSIVDYYPIIYQRGDNQSFRTRLYAKSKNFTHTHIHNKNTYIPVIVTVFLCTAKIKLLFFLRIYQRLYTIFNVSANKLHDCVYVSVNSCTLVSSGLVSSNTLPSPRRRNQITLFITDPDKFHTCMIMCGE